MMTIVDEGVSVGLVGAAAVLVAGDATVAVVAH
jgi:hypothetical protein